MKSSGIFVKVFIYTIIFATLLVGTTAALFSQQLISYFSHLRIQEITGTYQRMIDQSQGEDDIAELARQFYEKNQSLQFYIRNKDGKIVYKTPHADITGIAGGTPGDNPSTVMVYLNRDHTLHALGSDIFAVNFNKWIFRALIVLFAMLAVCIAGALVFARLLTNPIKILVENTNKMAHLEDVPVPQERKDELGTLTRNVYSMYDKLKETITRLEDEIQRERELEEAQRYFFSAASHELKTPIAATSALLEGMLENVGDYKDHPKYLRECMKMMDAQNRVVSEILEIVSLSSGKIIPSPERLDIRHFFNSILHDFHIMSDANAQRMTLDIPEGQICHADSQLLRKALSNVLMNAVQNTPKGCHIRIWSEPVQKHFRLCVLNTGSRIDDALLPWLFDPFFRVDKVRSRKIGRSGLGLTIVKKTLDQMQIHFALENTPEGVLFWMDLPRA